MSIDDYIAALKENRLQFDGATMELVQARNHEPVAYRGRGFVDQDKDGRLFFKLFVTEYENTDAFRSLNARLSSTSGQLFAPEDYYELKVVSLDGKIWQANGILPECSWPSHSLPIVSGKMNAICSANSRLESNIHHLSVHIFEDLELPIWPERDGKVIKLNAANCEFEVSKTGPEVLVRASSKHPLPHNLAVRIQEALKFITAKPAIIRAISVTRPTGTSWTLMSAPRLTTETQKSPPLGRSHIEFLDHGWDLFVRYLEFTIKKSSMTYWSHVTYHVHNATEASANSMDAWAVGVSVAVEGLANLIQISSDRTEKELVRKLKCFVLEQVKESGEFSSQSLRLEGLLGSMNNTRVQDRLRPLTVSGNVTSAYVKAWSSLRNKHVHPKAIDLKKLSEGDIQDFLDLIYKVTTLMHEIVFYLIDYRGPYQDFGSNGWPIKIYPHCEIAPSSS
jgi:hypothetical protein